MTSKRIVVFGATGAIGTTLIELLVKKEPNWKIIAVSRSGPPTDKDGSSNAVFLSKLPNVEIVKGDAEDVKGATEICRDASLVYCTVGFTKYQAKYWSKHWPTLVDSLLQATTTTKSRLVFCDNLYAYGPGTDISPSKSKRVDATLKSKFGVRATMHDKFQQHMDKHPKSLTVVGGADFFGPRAAELSALGDIFVGNIVKGSKPMAIGSSSVIHDVCYVPDFANSLYVASINDEAYDKFWICPHAVHGKTLQQVAQDVGDQVNGDKEKQISVTVMPSFMLTILGPIDQLFGSGFMIEMKEMLPWWTEDYTIDDSDFCQAFGVEATPYEEALATTIEFFRKREE